MERPLNPTYPTSPSPTEERRTWSKHRVLSTAYQHPVFGLQCDARGIQYSSPPPAALRAPHDVLGALYDVFVRRAQCEVLSATG